jgi:MoxR-like ATPase
MTHQGTQVNIAEVARLIADIEKTLANVVIDQEVAIRQTLLAIACGGHVLIEDVPGVGKTTLARAMAQMLGLEFSRVQGTPDRLPAEITGSSVWDARTGEFKFVRGPIFGQCILFDELNRAPAKTQAALLEAMEEGQVTVDGIAHALPRPFLVLATQNPIELEGTFPLPEAALDRFFVRVNLGYPSVDGEKRLLRTWSAPVWRMDAHAQAQVLPALLRSEGIFALRQTIAHVHFSLDAEEYLLALVHATRNHPDILLGLSPRAGLALKLAAQAWAAFSGNDHVRPDDIQQVLVPVAAHRLVLHPEADLRRKTGSTLLQELLAATPVAGSWAGLAVGAGAAVGVGTGAGMPAGQQGGHR